MDVVDRKKKTLGTLGTVRFVGLLWFLTWVVIAVYLFTLESCLGSFLCDRPGRPYSYVVTAIGLISSLILNLRSKKIALAFERRGASVSGKVGRFDIKFNRFISPTIVSVLYVLLSAAALLFVVFYWLGAVETVSSNEENVLLFALWSVPLAVVGLGILWIIIRLICESAIVIFRISDDLRSIRNRQGQ